MTLAEYQHDRKNAMSDLKIAERKRSNAIYWGEPSGELEGRCLELTAFIEELDQNWEKRDKTRE
jgi:hypothetical protein